VARSFQKPLPPPVPGESPVNAVPPLVVALALTLLGVEIVMSLGAQGTLGGPGAVGWRVAALDRFDMQPEVLEYFRQGGPAIWARLVSYAFFHGSVIHALFAAAMLLALGKFVGEGMGQRRLLAVLLAGTVGGALAFGLLAQPGERLFGAYPGVYGLIGAFTYLLWLKLAQVGGNRLQAFRMIGVLMALQLVFGALFGSNPQWIGDVGGFVVGGVTAVLVAPGGLSALRDRLRTR
jgi:membrane associated rhomboid family serine protease